MLLFPAGSRGLSRERPRAEQKIVNRIEGYALVGDCRPVALVGRDGSVDSSSLWSGCSPLRQAAAQARCLSLSGLRTE
jgi:hypothetical protein